MKPTAVLVECEGGFLERFLNEACDRGVDLWEVTRCDLSLFFYCRAEEYRRLRPAAKRASVRMRVREKRGIWFRIRPFRHRAGWLCGLVLFVGILQVLSQRIWTVRISGNDQVSDAAILDVLQPLGVYEGAVFDSVDLQHLQLTALEQLPQLVWLTVNRVGSVAYVEVRERTEAEPLASDKPANVVAACDGVILSVDCQSGQAVVKAGDAVTQGSLLISGVVDSKVGPLLKHAQGTVMARTNRSLAVTIPLEEEVMVAEPNAMVRPSVYLLGMYFPLYTSGEPWSETVATVYPVRAYGKALPIGLKVEKQVTYDCVTVVRNAEEVHAEALARLTAARAEWGEAVKVEQEQITFVETEAGWTMRGDYVCVESIGLCQSLQMHEKKNGKSVF